MEYWKALSSYLRARWGRSERASAFVEYLLIVALIAIVCMVAIGVFGGSTKNKFVTVANSIS